VRGFWTEVLAEALGGIPVFGLGLWFSHRKLRQHMTRTTKSQTTDIKDLTAEQTAELAGHLETVTAEQTAQLESGRGLAVIPVCPCEMPRS
jgi:hypothetical protein